MLDITAQKCYNEYEKSGRKTAQTRKACIMKKNTMNAILSLIADIDTPEAEAIREEITSELNRGAEKADANRKFYESAHDVIMGALSETPVTIAELYEEIKDALPAGFTKSKVQYAVTRLWADETVKVEGKVNAYTIKA